MDVRFRQRTVSMVERDIATLSDDLSSLSVILHRLDAGVHADGLYAVAHQAAVISRRIAECKC